jgi:glutamine cyclotransferase
MKKVTSATCSAFEANNKIKIGNTEVKIEYLENFKFMIVGLYLHGNLIAKKEYQAIGYHSTLVSFEITNAGWGTPTTKERLNGLNGVRIHQAKGQWYLNGKEWNGEWVNVNKWNAELEESSFVKNS